MDRILYISKHCHLSIKDANILVSTKDSGSTRVPIDDVSVVVLENNQSSMSSAFLSHLADKNIVLFSCDNSFMPNGVFLPYHQHSRHTEVSTNQLAWSEPFKKRVWQKVVTNKVKNQIELLEYFGFDISDLLLYENNIKSGDSTNVEATVASYYWSVIFSNSLDYFTRNLDDVRNASLNYGYAIIRGVVARSLVASGFTPFFGLHHHNKLNSFNLVDDLMEVFRCVVDREVYMMFEDECLDEDTLTKEIKKRLISLLDSKWIIEDKKYSLFSATNRYIGLLKHSSAHKDSEFLSCVKLSYEQ